MCKYINFTKYKILGAIFFSSYIIQRYTFFMIFYKQRIICSVTDLMIKSFT